MALVLFILRLTGSREEFCCREEVEHSTAASQPRAFQMHLGCTMDYGCCPSFSVEYAVEMIIVVIAVCAFRNLHYMTRVYLYLITSIYDNCFYISILILLVLAYCL